MAHEISVNVLKHVKTLSFSSVEMEKQRQFLGSLFHQLKLRNLDDWLKTPKTSIRENGGGFLLSIYSNELPLMLTSVYRNYPWAFEELKGKYKTEYFQNEGNQRAFMNKLYVKKKYKTFESWRTLTKKSLIEHGGKVLLEKYNSNLETLFSAIYPNYPWEFQFTLSTSYSTKYFKVTENQQKYMSKLFLKLGLETLDDWLLVPKTRILHHGGFALLGLYHNDFYELLRAVYPDHSWNFDPLKKTRDYHLSKVVDNQRAVLENVYRKLKFQCFDDWRKLSSNLMLLHGAMNLLKFYQHDIRKVLCSVYPNYPWETCYLRKNASQLKTLEKQRLFMFHLFHFLNLQTLGDWMNVARTRLAKRGGKALLRHYMNDKRKLLTTIYPNFPWNSLEISRKVNRTDLPASYFTSIENQRAFMDRLFVRLKLRSYDDWLRVSKHAIAKNGGRNLFRIYHGDIQTMLMTLYPLHMWDFSQFRYAKLIFQSITNQRSFMNSLYLTLGLRELSDWVNVPISTILQHRGRIILYYYSSNLRSLLTTVYPNYPWANHQIITAKDYFRSATNRRQYMNELYSLFEMTSLDDWMNIPLKRISQSGGQVLVGHYYAYDYEKLLSSIYPNFPFDFSKQIHRYNIDHQRKVMATIFRTIGLQDLDDWLNVTRNKFLISGGRMMLKLYSNDMKRLLLSVYPNHDWDFSTLKFRTTKIDTRAISFLREKVEILRKKFEIRQLKDWYRLPTRIPEVTLSMYQILKRVFPTEKGWDRSMFCLRTKKTNQRLLFIAVANIYPSFLILENYRHPHVALHVSSTFLEFDIFIPALNLAIEYQGEHHYDDIPSGFGFLEVYQNRDKVKEFTSGNLRYSLVSVPYWWDFSVNSLKCVLEGAHRSM